MTEMQILRNSLFDEIKRIKNGRADLDESHAIVKVSNCIINTYNTEIKAVSALIEAQDRGLEQETVKVFNSTDKNTIEYIGE